MPATFSIELLKAQAVAARTFAYKKIVDGTEQKNLLFESYQNGYLIDPEEFYSVDFSNKNLKYKYINNMI